MGSIVSYRDKIIQEGVHGIGHVHPCYRDAYKTAVEGGQRVGTLREAHLEGRNRNANRNATRLSTQCKVNCNVEHHKAWAGAPAAELRRRAPPGAPPPAPPQADDRRQGAGAQVGGAAKGRVAPGGHLLPLSAAAKPRRLGGGAP